MKAKHFFIALARGTGSFAAILSKAGKHVAILRCATPDMESSQLPMRVLRDATSRDSPFAKESKEWLKPAVKTEEVSWNERKADNIGNEPTKTDDIRCAP